VEANPFLLGQIKMRKILLIGIDGGSLDMLEPLMSEGKLPKLERLRKGGATGDLESTDPPISPIAWSSFGTGKNPGKHAIFDLVLREEGTYNLRPGHASLRKGKELWEILSNPAKNVRIFNTPLT